MLVMLITYAFHDELINANEAYQNAVKAFYQTIAQGGADDASVAYKNLCKLRYSSTRPSYLHMPGSGYSRLVIAGDYQKYNKDVIEKSIALDNNMIVEHIVRCAYAYSTDKDTIRNKNLSFLVSNICNLLKTSDHKISIPNEVLPNGLINIKKSYDYYLTVIERFDKIVEHLDKKVISKFDEYDYIVICGIEFPECMHLIIECLINNKKLLIIEDRARLFRFTGVNVNNTNKTIINKQIGIISDKSIDISVKDYLAISALCGVLYKKGSDGKMTKELLVSRISFLDK